MFTKRLTLFHLFGIAIKIDASWLLLAVLVTWSLARGVFPFYFPDQSVATYWWMAVGGAVGLFASIILHELGHAIVARHFGIPIRDITLFVFGGVAEMQDEPPSAKSEFLMAVAGPGTSVALGLALFGLYGSVGAAGAWPSFSVVRYLAWLNIVLAIFNMLPAFPLDGGRVLRAGLWAARDNLKWATRIASSIGSGFGVLLIVLGVLAFLTGNIIGGLWWFMIGMFMRAASQMSYKQLLVRRALEGESLRRFVRTDPVTVPEDVSVRDLVEDYIYKFHYKFFPVVDDGHLAGCVSTRDVKEVPREEWDVHSVRDILRTCAVNTMVRPDEDPLNVLATMNRSGNSRLLVVENDQLVGVVTLKDLLKFLSLKLDLEEEDVEATAGISPGRDEDTHK